MDQSVPQRKICSEDLLDRFKQAASQWLRDIPEARGLMLVIDWRVGKEDFPPCTVVTEALTERSTMDMLRQASKLINHLTMLFNQQIESADSVLKQAEAFIRQHPAEDKT